MSMVLSNTVFSQVAGKRVQLIPGSLSQQFLSPSLSPIPFFHLCPWPCPRSPFFKDSDYLNKIYQKYKRSKYKLTERFQCKERQISRRQAEFSWPEKCYSLIEGTSSRTKVFWGHLGLFLIICGPITKIFKPTQIIYQNEGNGPVFLRSFFKITTK